MNQEAIKRMFDKNKNSIQQVTIKEHILGAINDVVDSPKRALCTKRRKEQKIGNSNN